VPEDGGRRERAPTVVDVAGQAGVSRQTVSNVLNSPERVAPGTKARVQQAIAELGYRPNRVASNLKLQRTGLLGYRVPRHAPSINPVLDRFLHALTDAARDQGYHVLLFTSADGRGEIDVAEELMATRTVDGFVLAETNYRDERIRHFAETSIPFAAFGRTDLDLPYPWVDVDGAAGTALAVQHLAERGHERIAYLGWPQGSMSGDQRVLGFRRGLDAAGLDAHPTLDARADDGLEAGAEALDRWLALPRPPTAVVAASDLLALGVLKAARARGVRIGEDLAVTGFDDTPVAPVMSPPLTSLRQPLEDVAIRVVHLLTNRIDGAVGDGTGVALPPELVVRASSGPDPSTGSWPGSGAPAPAPLPPAPPPERTEPT